MKTRLIDEKFESVMVEFVIVYYESIKRELKTRPIYVCRCDERLKPTAEKSTRLAFMYIICSSCGLFSFPVFFPVAQWRGQD